MGLCIFVINTVINNASNTPCRVQNNSRTKDIFQKKTMFVRNCMEEMSGWVFSELKTEATENCWLFIQFQNNACYVCVNFIMSLQYAIPYF